MALKDSQGFGTHTRAGPARRDRRRPRRAAPPRRRQPRAAHRTLHDRADASCVAAAQPRDTAAAARRVKRRTSIQQEDHGHPAIDPREQAAAAGAPFRRSE